MSEFFENNENVFSAEEVSAEESKKIEDGYEGFDTVFSDPEEKRAATGKDNGKKRIAAIIAAVLAVAILVGGTLAVIELIPKKKEPTGDSSAMEEIEVLSTESDEFSKVTVTNKNGKFVFNSKKVKDETADTASSETEEPTYTTVWSVEGVDSSKTDSDMISSRMMSLESITASREITQKSAKDCGLENPSYKIDIESQKYGSFSVLIGDNSPDNTGTYLKLSTKDNIYLVDSSLTADFDFVLLDFADAAAFEAMKITDKMKDYTTDDKLTSFDKLTVSGKNFEDTVVIEANKDELMAEYTPYKVTSPTNQIADNIDGVLALFAEGLTVDGAYSFDVSSAELKKVGLLDPDIFVKIEVAGSVQTYKISVVDDSYCAVINDDSKLIKKVAVSNIPFINYNTQSFYSSWVFLRSINDISNITFDVEGKKYSFDIKYDDSEDAEETYVIKIGDKKLTAENFQNFYQEFISIGAADFLVEDTKLKPDMTVTTTYTKNNAKEVLTFTRTTATKYQYSLDGKNIGRVTSAEYNKVVKYLKMAAADELIKELE